MVKEKITHKNVLLKGLGERIKIVRNTLGFTQPDFAEKIGLTAHTTIQKWEAGGLPKGKILEKRLQAIEKAFPQVNSEYLREGKETPLKEPIAFDRFQGNAHYGPEDFIDVPVYHMAGAGRGIKFYEPEPKEIIMIPRQKMKQSMRAIKVRGPSMEPTILDGAIVGIDTDDRDIMSGLIYLVWKNYEGAVIRRVYVRSGKIILKPDNPVYPEDEIPPENNDENIIIGKVKWIFQSMP